MVAAQGQVNAPHDQQLVGPISPCLLVVADSGEHKTGCAAAFCPALRDCDAEQRQEMSSAVAPLATQPLPECAHKS